MNPNYHYQSGPPPQLPIPPYYPMMNNYGNNANATASPDSGIYCPQENPNTHLGMSDLHPLTPSLSVSPYYNQNESYHPYPQYQYHNEQQIPNNNFPVYRNPAINFHPPIPGNNNAILEGNSSRNRNETNSSVAQDGSMTGTTTTLGERLSISDNSEGNTRPVKVFLGRVTSLEGDLGVIDEETFFHISTVVKGTEMPKIGDNVLVKAEAVTRMPGFKWNAKELQLVKIGMNQEDHRKNLPSVPPAPKICMRRTTSAYEKSSSTMSRYKYDRDYSYNRRSSQSSSRDSYKYRSRSKSREKFHRERSSEWEYRNTSRYTRKSRYGDRHDTSQLIVRNKNKESNQSDNDTDTSELSSNETTKTFVKTSEELNICQDIHAIMNETLTTSPDPSETQKGTESEKSKDNERSSSVEYAKPDSENSELAADNYAKCISPDQTPIQIPGVLDNVKSSTQNPTNTEQYVPAGSSPNTLVEHALQDTQMKTEKVDPILANNLVTVGKTSTLSPTPALPANNTRIKQEPPEEPPKSPNLNKYSTILSTSLPNNHPIILPVEIDNVKEEPPEVASTELDEDLLANDSFLADKTPISTGPSASTAIVNPTLRSKNVESVSSIPNSLYFGIPEVITKIQDEKRDFDQCDELPTEIPVQSTSDDCFNNLVISDRLTSLVSLSDENVSVRLNNGNADLSVESISNDGKEVNEEGNTNSEGTGIVNNEIINYNADISNTDDQEKSVQIFNEKETLTEKSESHDHSPSETEIVESEIQNCSPRTLCGRPVQSLSPAQVLLNRVRKVRSGVNVKPKIQREETTTRKDPTDKKEIVNESITNDNLNMVLNDHVIRGFAAPLLVDETISDCLHFESAELPVEDCLGIMNLPNTNTNAVSCNNATIIETPDPISNICDVEKTGQILNPSIGNSEQNLNCHESVAPSNPNGPDSQMSPPAKNLIEVQLKEYSEIMRKMSVKRASEPGTSEGGKELTKKSKSENQPVSAEKFSNLTAKKRITLLRRPRVYDSDPYDEYANQSAEFFHGTAGHGPNYPNIGNNRWFDSYEEPIGVDSRRFNPRVDFSFNGNDPTFNKPREPWVPPQQFILPLPNDPRCWPAGIGSCQVCGEMGHESVCRRQSEIEFYSQESSIMPWGGEFMCQICGKSGHGANVCRYYRRNAKFDFGVEPPPAGCLFCGIRGHDVTVCRKRLKDEKCRICKEIGHHENVCRWRPVEPEWGSPLPDCSFCGIRGHDVIVCKKRLKDDKCKICEKIGHHENVCRRRPRDFGVEPQGEGPPPDCSFCGIRGHDVSVCRKRLKDYKSKIRNIGHHENVCRRRPRDFGVEPQGEGPPPDCSFCGIWGHDVSVCRKRLKDDKCKICEKIDHHENVCRRRPGNVEFDSGVEPQGEGPPPDCSFCGIRGHDISVCRKRLKDYKCKFFKRIDHHENVCRSRPRDFGVESQGEGPAPDCSFCGIRGHDISVCRKRLKDDKCKICKKLGHHENVCGRHPNAE